MKKYTLLVFGLLVSAMSFGQIELEHTYNNAVITRINLEYSGDKYYEFKTATNELVMYNGDHTLWKTILLPAPLPTMFTRTTLFHISEAKINPDTNLEIMFGYYDASGYECKVISEGGTVITTINNVNSVKLDEISGLPDKLITTFYSGGSYSSKVYSIPDFTLENAYPDGIVSRIKLENSGEKFYLLDKVNGSIKLYNQDHSLWKTTALPKPAEATYSNIDIVSESQINSDSLLEIGYTYYTSVDNITYTGKVINELGADLMTIPYAKSMTVNVLEGYDNKLMVTVNNASQTSDHSNSTNVYQLPSLALENAYESVISRVRLENSGEKYYTSQNPITSFAKVYNADHTLWKSVFLDIPFDSSSIDLYVNIISETKIAADPLLEIGYCYVYHSPFMYDEYYGQIMNENGLTYLNTPGAQSYVLSEFPDPIKLIELINFPDVFENTSNYDSNVYSIDAAMATNGFQKNGIVVAPNPANSVINIASTTTIIEAKMYNTLGAEVKVAKEQNLTKINLENLPSGMYFMDLTDVNHHQSTYKIIVSH